MPAGQLSSPLCAGMFPTDAGQQWVMLCQTSIGFVQQLLIHKAATQQGWGCPKEEFRQALRLDPGNIKSGRNFGFPRFWKCQNQAGKQNKTK